MRLNVPLAHGLAALALCAAPLLVQAQTHPLNDTGITWSGHATSGNAAICDPDHPAGQDCHYGRDKAEADGVLAKIGDGSAGFDFSKIANDGSVLPASATLGSGTNDWACTKDNVTGLIWEVKTTSGLRSYNYTYSWFMTGSPDGYAGTASGGTCKDTGRCDTEKYVADVNATNLCGHADWRMPTIKELEGIVDFGRSNPAIDTTYFPNTPSSYVWSGSPGAYATYYAWYVGFNAGDSNDDSRNDALHVRLVRAGQ